MKLDLHSLCANPRCCRTLSHTYHHTYTHTWRHWTHGRRR